ncbi:MAG: nucleotidyltransferase domain-containing protein [Thermodesulfobacteriota bacterium]|nr:nucleotidyltransferase domain-containing protein [Thermodesulfobacteriota bacterium]
MSVRVDLNRAQKVWGKNPSIVASWSFGSAKDGVVGEGSDLDIAVFFSSLPNLEQLAELRADLQDALEFDSIDLMILNSAGTISAMEAVSGKALYCCNRSQRAEFVSLVSRQYEDDMAFLEKNL